MGANNSIGILLSRCQAFIAKARERSLLPGKLKPPFLGIISKYNFEHEKILAVEISPHYIRVCEMKNAYDNWQLTQLTSCCIENHFTNLDIQENPELYTENLKNLIAAHHIKTTDVALSIPTSESIVKIINMPDMEESELSQAASIGAIWEDMVNLQGSINEYSVYYKILRRKITQANSLCIDDIFQTPEPTDNNEEAPASNTNLIITDILNSNTELAEIPHQQAVHTQTEIPAGNTPDTMDVLFVAAKYTDIDIYTGIARNAGLNPIAVDVKCNAIKRSFEANPEHQNISQPYAILEFGIDENYIYIINDPGFAIFTINLSSDEKHTILNYKDDIDGLNKIIENYAAQLQEVIAHYEYKNPHAHKLFNIYVNSNAPLHIDNSFSEPILNIFIDKISALLLDYKFKPSNFCNHIEVPKEFEEKVNAEGNLAAWATVLGLATYRLDIFNSAQNLGSLSNVNLLPNFASIRKNRVMQIASSLVMAVIFACCIFIISVSFIKLSMDSSKLTKAISNVADVKITFTNKDNELKKLSTTMEKIKSLDGLRSGLPSNQNQILMVYKSITNAIPEGVWLSELKFSPPNGVDIKGASINDEKITEFVNSLNGSGDFKKVSLKNMESVEQKESTNGQSIIKQFVLKGDLLEDASTIKLEIISGVK